MRSRRVRCRSAIQQQRDQPAHRPCAGHQNRLALGRIETADHMQRHAQWLRQRRHFGRQAARHRQDTGGGQRHLLGEAAMEWALH
jgi:hypothetical protein